MRTASGAPVNKGHFEFEPPERIDRYAKLMSAGWEDEYNQYRRLWRELPEKKEVRDYPLLVDLELVSRCNLKCPMCPTTTVEFKEKRVEPFKQGLMNEELAYRIIDEVAGKIYSLRLSWIGESTLHNALPRVIRYAKDSGIKEVSFLTNGYRMKLPYFIELAEAGIDQITISIDGTGETYNRIRKPLKWEDTLKKLQDIFAYKQERGLDKPVIKVQGIWPAIKEDPAFFYNTIAPLVDLVAYNPLIDYLHNDKDIVYEENFFCAQHYQRVVIGANGLGSMCSSDDFMDVYNGDANMQTIHGIWHGPDLERIRQIHAKPDGFMELAPCRQCFYPRATEVTESVVVNDRLFQVESYVNRSQVVGE